MAADDSNRQAADESEVRQPIGIELSDAMIKQGRFHELHAELARSTSNQVVRLKAWPVEPWPDATRAAPNAVLRSALFGVVERGKRRTVKAARVASLGSIQIIFTGETLDQGDLDVWAELLHRARRQQLGEKCFFTAGSLLSSLSKTVSGKSRQVLREQIERLHGAQVKIKVGKFMYSGHLINGYYRDEETNSYVVRLDPELSQLFGPDQFTLIDVQVRRALGRQALALWLHAFYASHAEPLPYKVSTLRELCGSAITRDRAFREKLTKALTALAEALTTHGQPFTFGFDGDLVLVERTATRSQQKHLAMRPLRRRPPARRDPP